MFNKQRYYKYANDIKFEIGLTYSLCTIFATFLVFFISAFIDSTIICIGIIVLAIIFASLYTKRLEIKLQEMYWYLDIYEKIANKKAD